MSRREMEKLTNEELEDILKEASAGSHEAFLAQVVLTTRSLDDYDADFPLGYDPSVEYFYNGYFGYTKKGWSS